MSALAITVIVVLAVVALLLLGVLFIVIGGIFSFLFGNKEGGGLLDLIFRTRK